ncbi:MAG: hypothetical protein ACREN6_15220 [Gemmatimonadaceae bacterium]
MEEPEPEAGRREAGASIRVSTGRKVAIGCFTAWLGLCSGAMVAALLSKFATFVTRAPECSEIPSCNWYVWAAVGGVIGAVTLPVLVLWTLGRPRKPGEKTSEF